MYPMKKIFFKKSSGKPWRVSQEKISKKLFSTKGSIFLYQSTQFFTEITNMGLFWLGRLENGRPIAIYGLFISQQAGISRFSSFFTILLNQKNLIFVISVKNYVDQYKNIDPFVENKFFEIFSWGTPQGFPLDF